MATTITTSVHYDTTDPQRPGWYASYQRDGEVIDDSEKAWHPEMPTAPDAGAEARRIATAYAASLEVAS